MMHHTSYTRRNPGQPQWGKGAADMYAKPQIVRGPRSMFSEPVVGR